MPDKLTLDINMAKILDFCLCWNQSYGLKSNLIGSIENVLSQILFETMAQSLILTWTSAKKPDGKARLEVYQFHKFRKLCYSPAEKNLKIYKPYKYCQQNTHDCF